MPPWRRKPTKKVATVETRTWRGCGGSDVLPLESVHRSHIPLDGDREILVWAVCEENGLELSRNLAAFARPKHWSLLRPEITVAAEEAAPDEIRIQLQSNVCAPWTRLDWPGEHVRWSDNFLHPRPRAPRDCHSQRQRSQHRPGPCRSPLHFSF